MKNRFKKHLTYYITFTLLQMIGLCLVFIVSFNKPLQYSMMLATTCLYISWALVHQYKHHQLTSKIVVEYVLVGFLGFAISLFIFNP